MNNTILEHSAERGTGGVLERKCGRQRFLVGDETTTGGMKQPAIGRCSSTVVSQFSFTLRAFQKVQLQIQRGNVTDMFARTVIGRTWTIDPITEGSVFLARSAA
jgi:hypothetical protein